MCKRVTVARKNSSFSRNLEQDLAHKEEHACQSQLGTGRKEEGDGAERGEAQIFWQYYVGQNVLTVIIHYLEN